MNRNLACTFSIAAALTASLTTVHAEQSATCLDLVKGCFAYVGTKREACFKAASSHSPCSSTDLGALATKRAALSSVIPPDEDGPSFLGPTLVDRSCVENFDNAWSGALIKGSMTAERHAALEEILSQCARVPSSDLLRP